MAFQNSAFSRRAVLTGAGIGIGSPLLAAAPTAAGKITSKEYWAKRDKPALPIPLSSSIWLISN